jgi:hypothetical protein
MSRQDELPGPAEEQQQAQGQRTDGGLTSFLLACCAPIVALCTAMNALFRTRTAHTPAEHPVPHGSLADSLNGAAAGDGGASGGGVQNRSLAQELAALRHDGGSGSDAAGAAAGSGGAASGDNKSIDPAWGAAMDIATEWHAIVQATNTRENAVVGNMISMVHEIEASMQRLTAGNPADIIGQLDVISKQIDCLEIKPAAKFTGDKSAYKAELSAETQQLTKQLQDTQMTSEQIEASSKRQIAMIRSNEQNIKKTTNYQTVAALTEELSPDQSYYADLIALNKKKSALNDEVAGHMTSAAAHIANAKKYANDAASPEQKCTMEQIQDNRRKRQDDLEAINRRLPGIQGAADTVRDNILMLRLKELSMDDTKLLFSSHATALKKVEDFAIDLQALRTATDNCNAQELRKLIAKKQRYIASQVQGSRSCALQQREQATIKIVEIQSVCDDFIESHAASFAKEAAKQKKLNKKMPAAAVPDAGAGAGQSTATTPSAPPAPCATYSGGGGGAGQFGKPATTSATPPEKFDPLTGQPLTSGVTGATSGDNEVKSKNGKLK